MKMIMMEGRREWFALIVNLANQLLTITFFITDFKRIRQPALPITYLPGVLKNQERGQQQDGCCLFQLKVAVGC